MVAACGMVNWVNANPTTPTPTETPFTIPVLPKETPKPTQTPNVASPTPEPTRVSEYTVQLGDSLGEIAERFGLPVKYLASKNDIENPDFILAGQLLTIPRWPPDPPVPDTQEAEIIVDLPTQVVCAAKHGAIIKCVLASTGVDAHPTKPGHYEIYLKVPFLDMKWPGEYNLKNVPWDLCFSPEGRGYCIHGADWHHNFGHQMSHGCVNLSVTDAEWFYNWAEVGTKVWVVP